jgi:predicted transposase/invertase (TIGR01784 family)
MVSYSNRYVIFFDFVDKSTTGNYNKTMSDEKKLNHDPVESAGCEPGPVNQQEKDFKVYLSHDGLFGFAFDKKNVAESFVKEYLPGEITKDLDFSTLTPDKDTFVDQKLSHCYSDILYHIRFRNNPAYLYFLFEHKSWEPNFPGVQLLKNMVRIWETHVEHHKGTQKLPPIIPLLIYHGEYPWKAGTNFISMFDIPGNLEKYIPAFSFELSDVSHMPKEEIKGDVELRLVLTAFRYIFQPDIMSRLKDIFQLFGELTDKTKFNQYLEALLIYLGSNIKDVKPEQLRDAVNEALVEGGAMMSTVFQQVLERGKEIGVKEGEERGKEIGVKEGEVRGEERGKEIGVKEGEEKNKLKVALNCLIKGMDIQTIAEITDLPVERIKLLQTVVQEENAGQKS